MIEIIFFIILAGIFFYVLVKNLEKNDSSKVIVKENQAKKAEDSFNIYEGLNKENLVLDLLGKAKRLYEAGAYKNCEKLYFEVIKNEPKNPEVYKGLGKLYLKQKNYEDAALSLEKATVLDENDDHSWNNLGLVYLETEQYRKAAYAYERAIKIDGKIPHRYINLGIILTKISDFDGASEVLEKAVKLEPKKQTYDLLLDIYKKTGNIHKLEKIKKAISNL